MNSERMRGVVMRTRTLFTCEWLHWTALFLGMLMCSASCARTGTRSGDANRRDATERESGATSSLERGPADEEPTDLAGTQFAEWAAIHGEELRQRERDEEALAAVPDELEDISTPAGAHAGRTTCANDELETETQGIPLDEGGPYRAEPPPEPDETLPGLADLRRNWAWSPTSEPAPTNAFSWATGEVWRALPAGLLDESGRIVDAERYHAWKERSLASN